MSEAPGLAPIVWDAGQARFAAEAKHRAIYMTGLGTAATFGLPDIGLIGLEEMASNVERIAAAVDIPVSPMPTPDTGMPLTGLAPSNGTKRQGWRHSTLRTRSHRNVVGI